MLIRRHAKVRAEAAAYDPAYGDGNFFLGLPEVVWVS